MPSITQILEETTPANCSAVRIEREPGTEKRYSGGGYTVLQQVMIDCTGAPFAEWVRRSVFEPLAMRSSTLDQPLRSAWADRAAAGLAKPDITILSDEFPAEVRGMPQRNLAVELLQKLLKGELAIRRGKSVVQARSFAEMLEQSIRRYQDRAIEAAQIIEELISLARQMRQAAQLSDEWAAA